MAKIAKETVKPFDPYVDLKWFKEVFIHDDKIVGERFQLKGRTPGETNFYTIGEAKTETYFIEDLEDIEHYNNVQLRPGVKEQIEEIKEEDDD